MRLSRGRSRPSPAAACIVGSQNGTVYSLDAKTGCIHWTFSAAGGVRTAIAVGPATEQPRRAGVFRRHRRERLRAQRRDRARRVDAQGRGPSSRAYHRLADACMEAVCMCRSPHTRNRRAPIRGTSAARSAAASARSMRRPARHLEDADDHRSAAAPRHEHGGRCVVGTVGIGDLVGADDRRSAQRLYVATGNAYSAPAHKSSDAVVALDLDSGAIRWMRQITPGDVYLSNCRAGNPNCPETNGPDFDFGSPPVLARAEGRDVLVIGQKSGIAFALDPAHDGEVMWEYRAGQGGVLGGIEWGAAVDGDNAYFAVSDILQPKPGGIHAVRLASGQRAWFTPPPAPICGTGRGVQCRAVGRGHRHPRRRLFGVERRRVARLFDRERRRVVGVRHEQGLHDRQRRARERRVADRSRSGRRRWYGLCELGIRRIRWTAW